MVTGGYTPLLLWSKRGCRKTRPREVPLCAPNCPKFGSDALARCPQPLPSTHTFFLFSSTLLVLTGPPRTRGLTDPPFDYMSGGVCPRKSNKCMYYPRVTINSPRLTEIIPLHDHLWRPQKQVQTHTCTRRRTTSRTVEGPNNRQLRVVAIDFSSGNNTRRTK